MKFFSSLQQHRLKYQPHLPAILRDFNSLIPSEGMHKIPIKAIEPAIQELFPHAIQQPIVVFKRGSPSKAKPLKVGIVFSGGQAPGGHNVIAGVFDALKKLNIDSQLIGFLNGPDGLIKNQFVNITEELIASYRNQGGFDLIGSGRTKIQSQEQLEVVANTLKTHHLEGLVIVGGDDSNTNAAFLAEFCHQKELSTRIIGVPKTIDGDLKNDFIEISFGFDTASKIYSEVIGNLLKDALSAKKYYFFVKMMGRSASHLTLECALQTQVNLALIGEEVAFNKQSLADIVNQVSNLICERAEKGKNFGVILIPEGLLEFIPECQSMIKELNHLFANYPSSADVRLLIKQHLTKEAMQFFSNLPEDIQKQLLLDRDPHGNIQLSKIETERLLVTLVERELEQRKQQGHFKGKFNPQPLFCGYEGRSGLPTNFDCNYCYALGHVAVLLIQFGASGYMCCISHLSQPIEEWEISGVPIVNMLHFEMRKNKKEAVIQKAFVNLNGPSFNIFKQERDRWRTEDIFLSPGPIQFEGSHDLMNVPPLSLIYEKQAVPF